MRRTRCSDACCLNPVVLRGRDESRLGARLSNLIEEAFVEGQIWSPI